MISRVKSLLPLLMVIFVDALGLSIVLPVYTILFLQTGALISPELSTNTREFLFGFILFLYPFCMFLVAPILGSMSDKYGRKKILIVAMLGEVIGFGISIVAIMFSNLILLFIGRIISGLTAGTIPIANAAIIDISTDKTKTFYLSLINFANNVGFIVGPIIGGFLIAYFGAKNLSYAIPMIFSGGLALLTSLLIIFLFTETFKVRATAVKLFESLISIRLAFVSAITRQLSIVYLLFVIGYLTFYWYLPVFLTAYLHFSDLRISLFLSNFGLWFALAFIVIPFITRRVSLHHIIQTGLFILIVGSIIFIVNRNEWLAWGISSIIGLCASITYVAFITRYANLADKNSRGSMMGIAASLLALGWAISPLLSGTLDEINSLLPYSSMILIFTLAFLLNWTFSAPAKKK